MSTVFDKIISGEEQSWKVWENDDYLAFLSPFPNTPGMTVVIPKQNIGDDVFELASAEYQNFLKAVKTVAELLKQALDVHRVALIFEGTGVAWVHAKLYPLHGELAAQTDVWSDDTEFVENYRGWLTTIEGPRMADKQLDAIQAKVKEANS